MKVLTFKLAVLLGVVPLPVTAAVTPISSSLTLLAEADAGTGLVQDNRSESQTATLNDLSVSVLAQSWNGNLTATAESDATASWTSADAGEFSLHTSFTAGDLSGFGNARTATDSPGWSYTFSSDQQAMLTLTYDVAHVGMDPYATLLFITESKSGQLSQWNQLSAPATSGSIRFDLSPGIAYTLQVYDDSNINQNLPALTSDMNATFSFSIVPVPEPTLLAMAGGAGLLLPGLRRSTGLAAAKRSRS